MTTCPTPPPAAKDRVVRVFVSSTFRDMVEDRNELMAHVWPDRASSVGWKRMTLPLRSSTALLRLS